MYKIRLAKTCRACGSIDLDTILKLDKMPPGDKYAETRESIPTELLPSDIDICKKCNHIQMSGSADPGYIYGSYLSRPASTNPELKKAYIEYCKDIAKLANGGSVLEVGSNDGLFLELFKELDVNAIGIEPAKNLIEFAKKRGVKTINDFVCEESAEKAVNIIGNPSVILSNHSFSNVIDIQEWATCLSKVLKEDGYLVLQTFYQKSVLENFLIENYNHEHLSYVFIDPISSFFEKYGLKLRKCRFLSAKGGSIRLFFQKSNQSRELDSLSKELLEKERVYFENINQNFSNTKNYITETKENLNQIFNNYSDEISAYGTSIGASVFTYQFGLTDKIKTFFDDDPLRQNRFSPGIGALVQKGRSPETNNFSHCLLFAPLYSKQIVRANSEFTENGGSFITIRPQVSIIKSFSDL